MKKKVYPGLLPLALLFVLLILTPTRAGIPQDQSQQTLNRLLTIDPNTVPQAVIQQGAGRFIEQCSSCHGQMATGLGPWNGSFLPLPANLTQVRDSPTMMFSIVLNGVPGTAMPPHPYLTQETFQALYFYIRRQPEVRQFQWGTPQNINVRPYETSVGPGKLQYVTSCRGCHGDDADGKSDYAKNPYVWPKPANFHARNNTEGRAYFIISEGNNGTMMPLQKDKIPSYAILALARYVQSLFNPQSTDTIDVPTSELPRQLNPYPPTDQAVVRDGEGWFNLYCAVCHSPQGKGGFTAPRLSDDQWIFGGGSDTAVYIVLEEGVPGKLMPSWRKITLDQRWRILTYLRSIGGNPEPIIVRSQGGPLPAGAPAGGR